MIEPYYDEDGITIFHGDALQILPHLVDIGAVITDPPYSSGGMFRSDRSRSTVEKYVNSDTMAYRPDFSGDNRDQRSFLAWSSLWLAAARTAATPGAPICSFIDWRQLPIMTDAVQAGGWIWRGVAVWNKGFGRPRPGGFSSSAEFVVWGSNGPMNKNEVYPHGTFHAPPPKNREHITQKPLEVMRWTLEIVPSGAVILDPFMGSGSTLRAAADLGYRAIGIECDEHSCEVAAKRFAQRTLW